MTAIPSDIARYTSDGVLITVKDPAIKEQDPNAADTGDREIEMFFDDPEHGQYLMDELFGFIGRAGRVHEAIEIADTLELGTTITLFPAAPEARLRDDSRRMNVRAALRSYSFDMGNDAYALEFVGLRPKIAGPEEPVFDTTDITFDNAASTWDKE